VNQAVALGMVVCVSAGNERTSAWGHIVTPADALGAIAVGAVTANNTLASFSSPGPTADGRIKPEVCARGVATVCAGTNNSTHIRTASGTSLSCPLVAGAVALVLNAHPDWTPAQVREALLSTADRAATPDNDFGWGRIRAGQAVEYTRAPEGLEVLLENQMIRLNWQPGVGSGYRVESAPGPAGPWSLLALTDDTHFLHETALEDPLLCYRVLSIGLNLP
jgi:subtilisin family serine protease